jgi:hypothetical protein
MLGFEKRNKAKEDAFILIHGLADREVKALERIASTLERMNSETRAQTSIAWEISSTLKRIARELEGKSEMEAALREILEKYKQNNDATAAALGGGTTVAKAASHTEITTMNFNDLMIQLAAEAARDTTLTAGVLTILAGFPSTATIAEVIATIKANNDAVEAALAANVPPVAP